MARRGRPKGETYAGYVGAYKRKEAALRKQGYNMQSDMLSQDDWGYMHKSNPELEGGPSNKELVDMQAYVKSRAQARALKKGIDEYEKREKELAKQRGEKYQRTFSKMKLSELRTGAWEDQGLLDTMIRERAASLRAAGIDSFDIATIIGVEFYGS